MILFITVTNYIIYFYKKIQPKSINNILFIYCKFRLRMTFKMFNKKKLGRKP